MQDNMEMRGKRKCQQEGTLGSSLLEILIVMMIISILSYLSISTYQRFSLQQQLIHSVRETIAFLSYQRQHALLFNVKIKITLLLSPGNKIVAAALDSGSSSEKKVIFQLTSDIELKQATISNFSFGGIRQTLKPMSFVLQCAEGEVKIIISSLGRIRACSQKMKAFTPC